MGEVLMKYYKYISDQRGLAGKTQLAKLTKIPSMRAAFEPDSVANIDRFRQAIEKLTGTQPPDFR